MPSSNFKPESDLKASLKSLNATHFEASLSLNNVRREQSGNYSCSPSNTETVSVRLHVIDGKIVAMIICH